MSLSRGSLKQRGTLGQPGGGSISSAGAALAGPARVLVACQSFNTNDVVWIDPATNTQVFDLAFAAPGVDATPTGLAVTSDGRIAYTTLKSAQGQAVVAFDTVTGKQIGGWIITDLQPLSCKISPDDRTLYVLCKQAKTLIAFDTATWARRWTASMPLAGPQSMDFTPDGSLMLVTDFTNSKVYPVTLAAGTVGAAITVGLNPFGITITADGKTAYVANNGQTAQSVSVIDIPTLTVTATIPNIGTPTFSQPLGIRVSPDQSTLWVTCKHDSTIVPISIPANTVGTPIPVASTPYLFAISDDGRFAYVSCYGLTDNVVGGFVTVVDLVNKVKVTDVPTTGGNPCMVVYARDRSAPRLDTLTTAGDLLVATAPRKVGRLSVPSTPGQSPVLDSTSLSKWAAGNPETLVRAYTKPAGWLFENMSRQDVSIVNNAAPVSGTMKVVAVALPKGMPVNKIGFYSGTTALAGGTHQWAILMDQNLNGLAVTNDDTVNAWAANTLKPFTLSSTFTTTYEGLYYCGLVVTATTTPSLLGHSISVLASLPPILNGDSTAGLSTPAVLPFTAAAPVSDGRIVYCMVG